MLDRIEIIKGDITRLEVDAIVNAANETLLGGGGVDGAIHRAAGPQLLAACVELGGCPTGEARVTRGYNLPATYVIHTVGPDMRRVTDMRQGLHLLASAYIESLRVANNLRCPSVAFPCISTGVYAFPIDIAAKLAIHTIRRYLSRQPKLFIEKVILCAFDDQNFDALSSEFAGLKEHSSR